MVRLRKLSEAGRNTLLAVTSSIVAVCVSVGVVELYGNYRYRQWKQEYGQKYANALETLTIASVNETLLWEYRPDAVLDPPGGIRIKTNHYGFRDLELHSPNKPTGVYRVAFVGDSVTVGLEEEFENIFVRKFEDTANKTGLPATIQALNFSNDGYNTVQIFELVRTRVLGFSSDKVVYVMCLNDFDFADGSGSKIRYFRKPVSFFLERIDHLIKQLRTVDYHVYHFARNKETVFSKISEMKILLDRRGIQFMVAIVPVFPSSMTDFSSYSLAPMHAEIRQFLDAKRIQNADLLDSFVERGGSPQSYSHDIYHPNKTGHAVIAQGLLQPVLSELRGPDRR